MKRTPEEIVVDFTDKLGAKISRWGIRAGRKLRPLTHRAIPIKDFMVTDSYGSIKYIEPVICGPHDILETNIVYKRDETVEVHPILWRRR